LALLLHAQPALANPAAPLGHGRRLVDQGMHEEPDRSAPRVCWIVDQGSSHRGATAARDLQGRSPKLNLVQLPAPAPWRNQVDRSCSTCIGTRSIT
jgi:hypothetical protein